MISFSSYTNGGKSTRELLVTSCLQGHFLKILDCTILLSQTVFKIIYGFQKHSRTIVQNKVQIKYVIVKSNNEKINVRMCKRMYGNVFSREIDVNTFLGLRFFQFRIFSL